MFQRIFVLNTRSIQQMQLCIMKIVVTSICPLHCQMDWMSQCLLKVAPMLSVNAFLNDRGTIQVPQELD
jgi:hypothetical protein